MKNTDYDINFNFIRFIKFLKKYDIISVAIASILSSNLNELVNSLLNNIILPIVNKDSDNDGMRDIGKIENYTFEIYGIKFTIGKFLVTIIKFIFISYIIYIISEVVDKYIDSPIDE